MKSLLTAIIPVDSISSAQRRIKAVQKQADLLELRLDFLQQPSLTALQNLTAIMDVPYILTLRSKTQGGLFAGNEIARLNLIKTLLGAKPDYLDIENDVADEIIAELHQLAPQTQLIRSFHNFHETPEDLTSIFNAMQHPDVSIYKLVTEANSSLDALRMMAFIQQHSTKHRMVGHCMGEDGFFSRIAGQSIGNVFTYAASDDDSPVLNHQATLKELRETYFLNKKNRHTQLFALLGDPISYSLGHIFHNQRFNQFDINALYIKIRLEANELSAFFQLIKSLPFSGFSITMPLKKSVLPFVENLSNLQAVNTLAVAKNKITAINTDGLGALDAIEKIISVKNKKILILGAGGAATAIIDTASQRGANLTIANRTLENAKQIAAQFPAKIIDFVTIPDENYDIMINTLPLAVFTQTKFIEWLNTILQHHPIVMDANYNRDKNLLLELCKHHDCTVIPGEAMFINQAIAQFSYWFKEQA